MIRHLEKIAQLLSAEYGDPLLNNKRDPIDEIVFILLSGKTDEAKYVAAFTRLIEQYTRWQDVLTAPRCEIEHAISDAGMGKRRAELLQRLLSAVVKRFGALDLSALASMYPKQAEEALLGLPGVGNKTARCVLLYCFDHPVLPVDVHTYRLAVRLGILSRRTSYDVSHRVLPGLIPEELRRKFHVNAVAHGRKRCFSRDPKCQGCVLTKYCSWPGACRPVPIVPRPKPLAIDLFAGAGGLSLGFKGAGFQVVQAVESDKHAAKTYRHNHPKVDLTEGDICNLDPMDCLQRIGLRPGDLTVLIGGPPCQGFSESNRRTRTLRNPKNHLYREYLRFLEVMRPACFVLENVAGLRTLSGGAVLQRILADSRALGYETEWKELNAAEYGVPQFRRRLFIVGNRLGVTVRFPRATHGDGAKPYVTVRDAVSDLPRLENGASEDYMPYGQDGRELARCQVSMRTSKNGDLQVQGNLVTRNAEHIIERYKYVHPGQNWEAIPRRLMDNYKDLSRCHTGIYYRLKWDEPSKVIGNFRKNMLIHPEQHRGLSVREAARLQSFPDHYEFLGSIGFQQQQVADAVPPLLAEAVARCIRRARPRKAV